MRGKKGGMLTPFSVRGEKKETMTWSEVVGLCACQCEDLTMRGRWPSGLEVFTRGTEVSRVCREDWNARYDICGRGKTGEVVDIMV